MLESPLMKPDWKDVKLHEFANTTNFQGEGNFELVSNLLK